ncbi:MAG: NAD(P)-dependent oxidoreductase [Paracoccaceae bacterium]
MKSFPMFIKMAQRTVVIVGGGEQAAQKLRLILKTEATIELLSPVLNAELSLAVANGRVSHVPGQITCESFKHAMLVFIATGCPGLDASISAIAKKAGALVNVVDQPALCDVTTPSIVDRDPVVIAIGTEGTAPVLARQIKSKIEGILHPEIGRFSALAGSLREQVAARIPQSRRRHFWQWVFSGLPIKTYKAGAEKKAASMLFAAISKGGPPRRSHNGMISVLYFKNGEKDLLTLRAVERLQSADVICYSENGAMDILELARRDAERVFFRPSNWLAQQQSLIEHLTGQGKNIVCLIEDNLHNRRRTAALSKQANSAASVYETIPPEQERRYVDLAGRGCLKNDPTFRSPEISILTMATQHQNPLDAPQPLE